MFLLTQLAKTSLIKTEYFSKKNKQLSNRECLKYF